MIIMDEFIYTLKLHIIVGLGLEDIKPEDIDDYAPLFGKGLDLESGRFVSGHVVAFAMCGSA